MGRSSRCDNWARRDGVRLPARRLPRRHADFEPPKHNLLADAVFEPRAGGHIYDRAVLVAVAAISRDSSAASPQVSHTAT